MVAFAFWPVGVFAFDEVVVEVHPFIEVIYTHVVFDFRVVLPPAEFITVVFPDVTQDAPVMPFN